MKVEQNSEKSSVEEVESRPITDADWDEIKAMMDRPYGRAALIIDGFRVDLQQQISKRKIVTVTFVNGSWKGEWLSAVEFTLPEAKHEEARRFFRPRSRAVHSSKDIKTIQKIFGKRRAKEEAEKRGHWFDPTWTSARSLRKHLEANNTEICVVKIGMV